MIKLTYYDHFTPLLQELANRSYGLTKEALSVGGSIIAKAARSKMMSHRHRWQQEVVDGKRNIYKADSASRVLGSRTSHSTGAVGDPANMASQIHFVVAKISPSVSVGGAHKDYRPEIYEDGVLKGHRGVVKAVGSKGRAILHKLNTGEVSSDHPYSKKSMFPAAKHRGRHFMEDALASTKGAVDAAIEKRYGKSFTSAVNNINTKAKVRHYG